MSSVFIFCRVIKVCSAMDSSLVMFSFMSLWSVPIISPLTPLKKQLRLPFAGFVGSVS